MFQLFFASANEDKSRNTPPVRFKKPVCATKPSIWPVVDPLKTSVQSARRGILYVQVLETRQRKAVWLFENDVPKYESSLPKLKQNRNDALKEAQVRLSKSFKHGARMQRFYEDIANDYDVTVEL